MALGLETLKQILRTGKESEKPRLLEPLGNDVVIEICFGDREGERYELSEPETQLTAHQLAIMLALRIPDMYLAAIRVIPKDQAHLMTYEQQGTYTIFINGVHVDQTDTEYRKDYDQVRTRGGIYWGFYPDRDVLIEVADAESAKRRTAEFSMLRRDENI